MPRRRKLTEIAIRHQVFLERLKTGRAREFANVFDDIDRHTREILRALDVDNIGNLTKRKLTKMLGELREANTATLGAATASLFDELEKLAAYEVEFEIKTLKHVVPKTTSILSPTAHNAYSQALAQPMSATGELLQPFVENWTDGELKRMNNTVQKAWAEGWTTQQLTQAIRGTKANAYKDGILATSKRNAEAVGRTAIQHTASMGRFATWEANKDIVHGYTFIATLDLRTTQVCRSLDQKKFKLGAGPIPPVHIGCRSTTIADVDPALDFLDEGATRSALDGPVSAETTYYDWLKGQPADFQDEAIGKTRGQLFRNGGLSTDKFAKLNLGRNFQPLTLDEMKKLEPLAFKRAGIDK